MSGPGKQEPAGAPHRRIGTPALQGREDVSRPMQGPSGGPFPDYPEPVECGEVMFSPLGKPPPDGWQIAGPLAGHHGHWSCLLHRKPVEAMNAAEIARKAADLVGGERAEQHGPVCENFGRIAAYWRCYITCRPDPDAPLSEEDVGHMLMLMKLARKQSGKPNPDNSVDMCGYAALAGEMAATRRSR